MFNEEFEAKAAAAGWGWGWGVRKANDAFRSQFHGEPKTCFRKVWLFYD